MVDIITSGLHSMRMRPQSWSLPEEHVEQHPTKKLTQQQAPHDASFWPYIRCVTPWDLTALGPEIRVAVHFVPLQPEAAKLNTLVPQ